MHLTVPLITEAEHTTHAFAFILFSCHLAIPIREFKNPQNLQHGFYNSKNNAHGLEVQDCITI
jgi:hypothetical protein